MVQGILTGLVIQVDINQHHNTIYTGETHATQMHASARVHQLRVNDNSQPTQREDRIQCQLILPRAVQSPDHRDWSSKNNKIYGHVEGLVYDDVCGRAEAVSLDVSVPVCAEGSALECTGQKNSHGPRD